MLSRIDSYHYLLQYHEYLKFILLPYSFSTRNLFSIFSQVSLVEHLRLLYSKLVLKYYSQHNYPLNFSNNLNHFYFCFCIQYDSYTIFLTSLHFVYDFLFLYKTYCHFTIQHNLLISKIYCMSYSKCLVFPYSCCLIFLHSTCLLTL